MDAEARRSEATDRRAVEQAGLAALIALLLVAVIAAVAGGGEVEGGARTGGRRSAAASPARRTSPTPATTTRSSPPTAGRWPASPARSPRRPRPLPGPDGLPLVPVDFRRCRRESCAVAAGPHLTASNRRTTAFTQLLDHRRSDGTVELIYWEYRPTLGWRAVRRTATAADVDAAAGTEVLASQDPALVPLETLPGRNHYDFPAAETPPWQWHVEARYPGWSD